MAVYGQYETVSELGRAGSTTVSRARPADGGWDLGFDDLGTDANFALKAFHVRNAEDAGGAETQRFLERVRAQKRAADAAGAARHWAPILDVGTAGNDAYYVTRHYPRTAATLAAAGGPIDLASLYAIVRGTLDGLTELRASQGRPHGNLKATNILIGGGGAGVVSADDVALTDPALEEDATIAGDVEDLYNLGEVIHRLVLGTRFPGQHTWPVPASPRWDGLGKSAGPRWLALCNHLLSPRAAENWLRVDDIVDVVAALAPRRSRLRSRKLWAAVAAVAIVAGAGTGEYFRHVHQWRDLCAAYGDWAGPLSVRLAKDTPREIAQDAYLQERVVGALAEARRRDVELDPRAIAGSDQPLAFLAERPPLSFGAIWKTERAWRVVRGVDQSLSPRQWQALTDLAQRRADYEKRGWPRLARYATNVADLGKREPGADWAAGIAAVLEGRNRLAGLDAARTVARARMDHLVARAEGAAPIRDRISEFETLLRLAVESDALVASSAAVDSLASQLRDAEQSAARFDDLVPLLAEAAKRQRAYEVRGWAGPARSLAALVGRARPDGEFAGLPEALASARRAWEQVETQWSAIEKRRRLFEMSGDRVLATYRQYVAQARLAEQTDLAALLLTLQAVNDDTAWAAAAKKVGDDGWARFDVVEFAQKSAVHRGFAGRTAATAQDVRKWLAEAEAFGGSQLASATMKPDGQRSGAGNGGGQTVVTVPKPPTTVATVTPKPTTLASAVPPPATTSAQHKPPTPLAMVTPPKPPVSTTQKSPTTVALVTPPATAPTVVKPSPPPATVAVVATKPAVDPEQLRLEREIVTFVTECREVGLKVASRDIQEAWRAGNAEFASRVGRDHKAYAAVKAQRERLRGRLLQLDSAHESARAPLALKSPPGASAWGGPLVTAVRAAEPQWAGTVKGLIAAAAADDAKFEDALGGLVDADEQWRAAAARLVADAGRVEQLLADGYTPADKAPPDGATVASVIAAVRSGDLYRNDGVRDALEPLVGPLAAIEKPSTPSAMRLLAAAGDQPLGVRLAAWGRAGRDASRAALDEDLKLAGSLLAAAQAKVPDKARVEGIKGRLEADVRAHWEAVLDGATRGEDVEAAIGMRDRIAGVVADKLPPRARFNLALHDLRAAVAAAKGDEPARAVAPAAERLKAAVAALDAAQSRQTAVATVAAEVDRLGAARQVDVSKLGPRSEMAATAAGRRIDWSPGVEESGEKVTYRAALAGNQELTLVFRRVHPGGSSRASWVCTSEASLGVFADLLTAGGKWPDVRAGRMLTEYDALRPATDPRRGPRVWEWPPYGRTQDVTWARTWLGGEFVPSGAAHYPDAIRTDFNRFQIRNDRGERSEELNPSRRQPAQYVSPRAAALAASVAGCRLPTVAEWRAAYKSVEQHVGVNLRDRTWRLELDHLNRVAPGGRCRPDAGMFVPDGERPSDDAGDASDGVLWFREAPPAAPVFADLVGNVGELVTDDAGKLYVIGGSALSPPDRAVDRPYAVAADQAAGGFSDVGFRLAFGEPAAGIDRLREAVAGGWYLTGP